NRRGYRRDKHSTNLRLEDSIGGGENTAAPPRSDCFQGRNMSSKDLSWKRNQIFHGSGLYLHWSQLFRIQKKSICSTFFTKGHIMELHSGSKNINGQWSIQMPMEPQSITHMSGVSPNLSSKLS